MLFNNKRRSHQMKREYKSPEDLAADESFQNYCQGSVVKDVKKWERWLKNHPQSKEVFEEARFLVLLFTPEKQVKTKHNRNKILYRVLRIAGVFLIFISSVWVYNFLLQEDFAIIKKTAENSNIELHLSDLTLVQLRKGSSIEYKESWENSKQREVWLTGEAFFDVTKSKPFLVHLKNGTISVLGTKFLAKGDSLSSIVLLEEGKIVFETGSKTFEMNPGDRLEYNSSEVSVYTDSDIELYRYWMKSSLVFKNEPLKNVIEMINKSYDLKVELGNQKLGQRKITTTIDQNDPMLLLTAIAEIYGIELIEDEKKIILK